MEKGKLAEKGGPYTHSPSTAGASCQEKRSSNRAKLVRRSEKIIAREKMKYPTCRRKKKAGDSSFRCETEDVAGWSTLRTAEEEVFHEGQSKEESARTIEDRVKRKNHRGAIVLDKRTVQGDAGGSPPKCVLAR